MKTLSLSVFFVVISLAHVAAEEIVPPPPQRPGVTAPEVQPSRFTNRADGALAIADEQLTGATDQTSNTAAATQSKVEHLREAARHLRAAGFNEQAQSLESEAVRLTSSIRSLLHEKQAELKTLLREISDLQKAAGIPAMVRVNCRFIELPTSSLAEFEIQHGVPNGPKGLPFLLEHAQAAKLIALADAPGGKILAETQLLTEDGRPANLVAGGEYPVPAPREGQDATIEYRPFGVRIDVLPLALGNDKLRLDIGAEYSTRDEQHSIQVAGVTVPGLSLQRSHTAIELQLGKTALVSFMTVRRAPAVGGDSQGDDQESRTLLILVTPDAAEPLAPPQTEDNSTTPATGF